MTEVLSSACRIPCETVGVENRLDGPDPQL